jgi:hypothetical protein
MINKTKSWTLLLVFSLSLVPFSVGQAEIPVRTFEEARSLLYLGDAFLEDEANLDTAVYFPEMAAPAPGVQRAEGAEEVMGRMIHAAKQERNDLDANCRQLQSRYQTAGDQEAVRKLKAYCDSERQRLTNRIGFLHKLRGDRRKLFTRWWHSIKRSSANLWRRIGPLGRNILRKVGDEAFNTVVSGGTLGGGVARDILKRALTSTGRGLLRETAKRMVLQGMQELVQGQVQIAREAGIFEDEETGDSDVDSLLDSLEQSNNNEAQELTDLNQNDNQPAQDGEEDPADTNTLELTPQEEANKGTHMYLVVCHGSEMACATRPTMEVEISIVFLEGAVKVNGNLRQKVGLNQYVWQEDYVLTFTMDGMTNAFPDGSSDVYSRKN